MSLDETLRDLYDGHDNVEESDGLREEAQVVESMCGVVVYIYRHIDTYIDNLQQFGC